jgi:hypothetical protein
VESPPVYPRPVAALEVLQADGQAVEDEAGVSPGDGAVGEPETAGGSPAKLEHPPGHEQRAPQVGAGDADEPRKADSGGDHAIGEQPTQKGACPQGCGRSSVGADQAHPAAPMKRDRLAREEEQALAGGKPGTPDPGRSTRDHYHLASLHGDAQVRGAESFDPKVVTLARADGVVARGPVHATDATHDEEVELHARSRRASAVPSSAKLGARHFRWRHFRWTDPAADPSRRRRQSGNSDPRTPW